MSDPERIKALLGEYAEYPCTPEQEAKINRWRQAEKQRKEAEEFELLKSMAHKAQSGVYGKACQDLARDYMAENAQTKANLETLRKLLRKVPGRISG